MARRGFITGGTWCVDYNMVVDQWPAEETANPVRQVSRVGGGSGCNFAVDMRRLAPEIPVSTISLCGEDADGVLLRQIAVENGIEARFHVDPSIQTHRTLAFTAENNGKRTHLFEAASSDKLSPEHFDFSGSTARLLHLGLPGTHALMDRPYGEDANGWVTVLKKAHAAGLQTNLEVMTIPKDRLRALVLPCLPHLDYLVVNDYEIGALAGVETLPSGKTSVPAVIEAARRVLRLGAMEMVVVHFPQGAIALGRDGALASHPSVRVPPEEVAGSNGAGDAFAAGFFCGLHRGKAPEDCLAYAHASAATSLRSVDTYSAMEPIEACLARAESFGWRPALDLAAV